MIIAMNGPGGIVGLGFRGSCEKASMFTFTIF
jgi:hypothetical protein